ncbi:unnamed protein product [Heterobilharzia americana]|nr:unnamed protein product [Heterobilharzia americana]
MVRASQEPHFVFCGIPPFRQYKLNRRSSYCQSVVLTVTRARSMITRFFDQTQWQNLVAGVTGGVASALILHPLDLVKIRLQVNEGTGVIACRPKTTKVFRTLYDIAQYRGFRGLYLGLTPNVIGAGTSWVCTFSFMKA